VGGAAVDAIAFGGGERIDELFVKENGKPRDDLEITFTLDENEYNGRITPQLVIRDFK
jgi:hypothetical protein